MVEIIFDFDTEGSEQEDSFLDPYEINMMFEQTRRDLGGSIERKLHDVVCTEHNQPPRVILTGRYNQETEQMDINYHVDTCCQMFLVRVVSLLNLRA
jgi:hypothetical protein